MVISNKTIMYKYLEAGLFGNRFRIWYTIEDMLQAVEDGFDWLVGVRFVGVPGLPYYHHKTPQEAIYIANNTDIKYPPVFYEASPDQFITIQGEITDYPHGYGVEWSTVKTHMRAALAAERLSDFNYHIPAIIRKHFNDSSYQDLLWLFDTYPGCTIEFTCYETIVGQLPGRNTVLWECRHY